MNFPPVEQSGQLLLLLIFFVRNVEEFSFESYRVSIQIFLLVLRVFGKSAALLTFKQLGWSGLDWVLLAQLWY